MNLIDYFFVRVAEVSSVGGGGPSVIDQRFFGGIIFARTSSIEEVLADRWLPSFLRLTAVLFEVLFVGSAECVFFFVEDDYKRWRMGTRCRYVVFGVQKKRNQVRDGGFANLDASVSRSNVMLLLSVENRYGQVELKLQNQIPFRSSS